MQFCEPARVIDAQYLTSNMIRIRLEILGDWRWPTHGIGDDKIDLAFPRAGETKADVEYFNRDDYGSGAPTDEPPWRHYTVRRVHDGGAVLDIDFVVHEGGFASEWAARAEPGHVLGVFSTRPTPRLFRSTRQHAAAAARGRCDGASRTRGASSRGCRPEPRHTRSSRCRPRMTISEYETAAEVTIDWLIGTGLGRSRSALPEAVEAWSAPSELDYAWVACESAASRRIRRHLRAGLGLDRRSHIAVGYWTDGHIGHFEQDEHPGTSRHEHDAAH